MTTLAHTSWITQILSLVPSRVLTALDAWSYRVALKHAERRRRAISARKARAATVVAQYQFKS